MRIVIEGLPEDGRGHIAAEIVRHLRHCGYHTAGPGDVPKQGGIRVIETNEPIGAPICGEDGQ